MALGETKRVPVSWSEKVMIGRNPGLTDEQAAAAHKLLVAVDPDVEFWCVSFRERTSCMLSTIRPRFDVENRRVRRKTLGNGVSRFERGVSGPNKMTVGWLILTVPRRKRVSQAVTDEMASARTDIASENAAITSPLSHTSCHVNKMRLPLATPSRCFASTPRGRAAARLMTPEGVIADQKARPHVSAATCGGGDTITPAPGFRAGFPVRGGCGDPSLDQQSVWPESEMADRASKRYGQMPALGWNGPWFLRSHRFRPPPPSDPRLPGPSIA